MTAHIYCVLLGDKVPCEHTLLIKSSKQSKSGIINQFTDE